MKNGIYTPTPLKAVPTILRSTHMSGKKLRSNQTGHHFNNMDWTNVISKGIRGQYPFVVWHLHGTKLRKLGQQNVDFYLIVQVIAHLVTAQLKLK